MSTTTKTTGKTAPTTNINPAGKVSGQQVSCNYDASRIFRFEVYAQKLRQRAGL